MNKILLKTLLLLFSLLNHDLFAENKVCKNLCKVRHYIRQKCTNDCINDGKQSELFKMSCLEIGGSWNFVTSNKKIINGFQCEFIKEKNINKNNILGLTNNKCSSLNLGSKFNELQIISEPLILNKCPTKISLTN